MTPQAWFFACLAVLFLFTCLIYRSEKNHYRDKYFNAAKDLSKYFLKSVDLEFKLRAAGKAQQLWEEIRQEVEGE